MRKTTIIQEVQPRPGSGNRRVLAVVAIDEARASEMALCFAAAGDAVEAVWYRDLGQLREMAAGRLAEFEAVVWFDAKCDVEVAELREWLRGTPLIEAV